MHFRGRKIQRFVLRTRDVGMHRAIEPKSIIRPRRANGQMRAVFGLTASSNGLNRRFIGRNAWINVREGAQECTDRRTD
jgi:hypothetical protein